jgi:hypothetical protein
MFVGQRTVPHLNSPHRPQHAPDQHWSFLFRFLRLTMQHLQQLHILPRDHLFFTIVHSHLTPCRTPELSSPLQPIRLLCPLLDDLLHLLPPFLSQCDKDPKPCCHLHEAPCEDYAVVEICVAGGHHVVVRSRGHHTAFLERVGICCQGEEEQEAHGCLDAPVFVRELFGHGYCGQVGEAEECEEDAEEGDGGGWFEKFAGSWL